ncbi:MAG: HNH endonuclease [Limisphaerales bacterium]
MSLSAVITSRLAKAAADNGFDRELANSGDWLAFASTQCPLRIWLGATSGGAFAVALSQQNVALAIGEAGASTHEALPMGAVEARLVVDIPALHRLLRRAFQLSRSLPDELLNVFQARTANLPRATEVERLVIQRVGQDIFRDGLLEFWEGRCAVTGLAVPELLRASHIKPWAVCETDAERLDVYNGLLFAPHLDAVFDQGFITVSDCGEVIVSPQLDEAARQVLGLETAAVLRQKVIGHQRYLCWHRERVFRREPPLGKAALT